MINQIIRQPLRKKKLSFFCFLMLFLVSGIVFESCRCSREISKEGRFIEIERMLRKEISLKGQKIAFRPQKTEIAVFSTDGKVRIWNWKTEEFVLEFDAKTINPKYSDGLLFLDKKRLLIAQNGSIDIWQVETGTLLKRIKSNSWICSMDYFPAERLLAFTGGFFGEKGKILRLSKDYSKSDKVIVDKLEPSRRIKFTQDGKYLLQVKNGKIVILKLKDNSEKEFPHGELSNTVTSGGGLIAWGEGSGHKNTERHGIHVMKLDNYEYVDYLAGHEGATNKIVFVPGRKILISTGADGCIKVWNLENEALVVNIKKMSIAHGGELKLEHGKGVYIRERGKKIRDLIVSHDGEYFAYLGDSGILSVFKLSVSE